MLQDIIDEEPFCGHKGSTYRKDYLPKEKEYKIERVSLMKRKMISDESTKEIPITEIDQEFFDPGFYIPKEARKLNSRALWESLPEKLQELACNISQEYNRRAGTMIYKYDVPISGHLLLNISDNDSWSSKSNSNKKISSNQKNWFFYNNNFYNPSFLYYFNSSMQLIPICRYITHKSLDPNMTLGPVSVLMDESSNVIRDLSDAVLSSSSKSTSIPFRLNKQQYLSMKRNEHDESKLLSDGNINSVIKLNRIACESFSSSSSGKRKSYYQIDLKDIFVLDRIGVIGGYPNNIKPFTREKANRESYRIISKRKRQKYRGRKAAFVYILNGEMTSLGFIKKYEIYYRNIVTNKWEKYQNIFDGNDIHNIFSEVRSSVQILARYIRIIPLEYNASVDFRINIYGNKYQPTEYEKAKYGITLDTGNTSSETSKDMMIRYIVTSSQNSNLRNDGAVYSYKDYYGITSKFKKRNDISRLIEEDQDFYYNEMSLYD